MKLFGLILTYNCENLVEKTINSLSKNLFYKIICSDDGSVDNTKQKLIENNIDFFSHKHTGYGGNLLFGLKKAFELGATHVVEIHGDGQYDFKNLHEIKSLFEKKNSDLILGNRFYNLSETLKNGMPFHIFLGNIFFSSIARIGLGLRHKDLFPGQRAYSKNFFEMIINYELSNGYQFSFEIIALSKLHNLKINSVNSKCNYKGDRKTAPLSYTLFCFLNIIITCILYRLSKKNVFFSSFKKKTK